MSNVINKEYVKKLALTLYFELSDEQAEELAKEIQGLEQKIENANYPELVKNYSPVNYARVVNCAKMRKDKCDKKLEKDYLANAKRADKYVVGK